MDRLHVGYNPNDAEVDSLLSQLNDESLLKLKENSHSHRTSAASCGFEYPTFTDGWTNDDDDNDGRGGGSGGLDNQLASRFSSLKLPISSVKKKGRDPSAGLGTAIGRKKGGSNSDRLARKGSGGGRDYHYSRADSGGKTAADYWEALAKQGRDSGGLGRRRSSRDYEVMGKKGRDLQAGVWKGRNLEAVGEEGEEEEQEQQEREDGARNSLKASTRSENGGDGKQPRQQQQQQSKGESSRALSQKTELLSCKSSDDLAAAAAAASDGDGDELANIDAQLHERFRALKAPPPPPSPVRTPISAASSKNAGLKNLLQFSEQQQQKQQSIISSSNSNDYDSYGSYFSTPTSPSAKLLGRSKSRSSPRVMTTSVSSSCHCSAPSPLKLLKQVSSKSFPAKQQYLQHQQLPHSSSGGLPPASSSASALPLPPPRSPPVKSKAMSGSGRDFKVEGFGNFKPSAAVKEIEKLGNEKREKKSRKELKKETKEDAKKDTTAKKQVSNNSSGGGGIGNSVENSGSSGPSTTVKDMRRLLSSVADRVGLERSRVSSAEEDDFLGGEDLRSWAVLDDGQPEEDDEFSRVSTEEKNLSKEAERVVEWAKDAARLGPGVGEGSDEDSDDDAFKLGSDDDGDSDSGDSYPSDGTPPKKEKKIQKEAKVPPKKKKWGLFN